MTLPTNSRVTASLAIFGRKSVSSPSGVRCKPSINKTSQPVFLACCEVDSLWKSQLRGKCSHAKTSYIYIYSTLMIMTIPSLLGNRQKKHWELMHCLHRHTPPLIPHSRRQRSTIWLRYARYSNKEKVTPVKRGRISLSVTTHTQTHTHIYIHIHIYNVR